MKLRDYQEEAKHALRSCYASKRQAPLLVLPTGGGKTAVMCNIAQGVVERGKRGCILVHRKELLDQTSKALHKIGVEHGVISPHYPSIRIAPIQVASVQALVNRLDHYDPFDFIFIDEAHHAVAGTWDKIITHYSRAKFLGVTATPCRLDGKPLNTIFDELVEGPSSKQMIERGYLVKPRVFAPPVGVDFDSMHLKRGDFDTSEVEDAMNSVTVIGDVIDHYRRYADRQPAIAFCATVKHARAVADAFIAAGYPAASVDGKDSPAHRERAIDGLTSGKLTVLTSCNIISEGTDIPRATVALLLRPTMSLSLYLQMVGRVLRPVYAPGYPLDTVEQRLDAIAASEKPFALVLDHVTNVHRLGMPTEDREWSLEVALPKVRKKGQEAVELLTCPECSAMFERSQFCPECSHMMFKTPLPKVVINVEGSLVEMDDLSEMRGEDKVLAQLKQVAAVRGYDSRWPSLVVKNRRDQRYFAEIDVQTAFDIPRKQLNHYLTGVHFEGKSKNG